MRAEHEVQQELEQVKQAVQSALEQAQQKGATSAEVSIQRHTGISVSTRLGEIEQVEFNKDGALGIAVYVGQHKGTASTSDLSESAIRTTVEAALNIARYTSEDPYAGVIDKAFLAQTVPAIELYYPAPLSPEHGIALAQATEHAALAADARIVNSDGASYASHYGVKVVGNSHGFLQGYFSTRHSLSCVLIAKDGEQMQRDYGYTLSRDPRCLMTPQQVAQEAVDNTLARLNARKVKTAKVPVVFAPDCAAGLFASFVAAISGGNLYRNSSFLLNKLHTQILPDWFAIDEQPHVDGGLGSAPFDAEGGATVGRMIVDNGILQTYLLPSYAARKMGMTPTGHAGGIHNWTVAANAKDQDEVIASIKEGLLVTELMGQGVNVVTGDYSRGAAGFWIENGKIAYPVHEVTIAGNLADMFMNIQAVGADRDLRGALQIGSTLVREMQVAGS